MGRHFSYRGFAVPIWFGVAALCGSPEPSLLVSRVVEGPAGAYFTYPHANGFWPDGHTMVIACPEGRRTDFALFDPDSGKTTAVASLDGVKMYYGVSRSGILVTNANNSLVVIDLTKGSVSARVLWESMPPWRLSDLPDISEDGSTVLADFHDYSPPGLHQMRLFEVDGDNADGGRVLLEKPWLLNHTHRSPADPNWVLFSHEGRGVSDRMWAWHADIASQGRNIFNQQAPDGKGLFVGHELAMHHKPAALAVAFGNSPGSPRGLYEIGLAGGDDVTTAQLVRHLSSGAKDWHANISRDGRWAVVDTMGPSDDPGPIMPGWADKGGVSDVIAVNLTTGARRFLHRGTFLRRHPWHPHPHISPDGRWVIYNDAESQRVRALEIDPAALEAFLGAPAIPDKPVAAARSADKAPRLPWDMAQLARVPTTYDVSTGEVPPEEGMRALYFEGPRYRGERTRVFALMGLPEGASVESKVPGIVLVHGAGGTAFADWVKLWTSRGYAAIAFDHNGGLPVGKYSAWKRNPRGGPSRNDIDFLDRPLADQWMYHGVADTILAHSLLRSLPEVDADRIGITGISLGGVITSTVSGIDHRLKFAAPVYGCGHIADEVDDGSNFVGKKGTPEQRARWREIWDPANYLPLAPATLPVLWVNGTNDFAFTMRSWDLTIRDVPGATWRSLRVRMPHGHGGAGESPEEIHAFADSVVFGGKPLARVFAPRSDGSVVTVAFASDVPIRSAVLNYTRDIGPWQERLWESQPAEVGDGQVLAQLPKDTAVYFVSVVDERGLLVSSGHKVVGPETR